MTRAQKERQRAPRKQGRYAKFNPCEVCGQSAGSDYLSHPECNQHGIGVVLCHRAECFATMDARIKARCVACGSDRPDVCALLGHVYPIRKGNDEAKTDKATG